jgi:Trp operon repressor
LLLCLDALDMGRGREQDAALRRLRAAAGYERAANVDAALARFNTKEDVAARDDRIMRLAAERYTDREIATMVGVHIDTVVRAKNRVLVRRILAELHDQ